MILLRPDSKIKTPLNKRAKQQDNLEVIAPDSRKDGFHNIDFANHLQNTGSIKSLKSIGQVMPHTTGFLSQQPSERKLFLDNEASNQIPNSRNGLVKHLVLNNDEVDYL